MLIAKKLFFPILAILMIFGALLGAQHLHKLSASADKSPAPVSQSAVTQAPALPVGAIEVAIEQVDKLRATAIELQQINVMQQAAKANYNAAVSDIFGRAGKSSETNQLFEAENHKLYVIPQAAKPEKK